MGHPSLRRARRGTGGTHSAGRTACRVPRPATRLSGQAPAGAIASGNCNGQPWHKWRLPLSQAAWEYHVAGYYFGNRRAGAGISVYRNSSARTVRGNTRRMQAALCYSAGFHGCGDEMAQSPRGGHCRGYDEDSRQRIIRQGPPTYISALAEWRREIGGSTASYASRLRYQARPALTPRWLARQVAEFVEQGGPAGLHQLAPRFG